MYKIVLHVDAGEISELLNSIPALRAELSKRYECSGTATSFVCVGDNEVLIKVIPALLKSASSLKGRESLVPSQSPHLFISIEGTAPGKLMEAWNLITKALKSAGLKYAIIE